jgi:translation initiation factor 1
VARGNKQRIATDAAPALQTNPFAALDLGVLPAGPADPPQARPPAANQTGERLLLRRETAHRGGKTVLVLERFSAGWTTARLHELLRELKSSLGCGGRVDARRIELQGELADRLIPLLQGRGWSVKRGW